jgi:hypothetical protein
MPERFLSVTRGGSCVSGEPEAIAVIAEKLHAPLDVTVLHQVL